MISDLAITGLRSARDVLLPDLGQVNIFVGPNGSGKTSLLYGAYFFCLDANTDQLLWFARPETERPDMEAIERALRWFFWRISDSRSTEIAVKGHVDGRHRRVTLRETDPKPGLTRAASGDNEQTLIDQVPIVSVQAITDSADWVFQLSTVEDNHEDLEAKLYLSRSRGVFSQTPSHSPRMVASMTRAERGRLDLAKLLDESQNAGSLERVEEMLRRVDPGARHLRIGVGGDGTPVVRVDHERLGLCPLNILGDGFPAALHFALRTCSRPEIAYVIFDEFDASLHVSVLRGMAKFVKAAAEDGTQFFLSTHRADTVGAFVDLVEDGWDGLRVFQTRLEDGETKVQAYSSSELVSVLRELALDIRVPE